MLYYSQVCKSYKSTLKSVKFVILVWFTIGLIHCLMIFFVLTFEKDFLC